MRPTIEDSIRVVASGQWNATTTINGLIYRLDGVNVKRLGGIVQVMLGTDVDHRVVLFR